MARIVAYICTNDSLTSHVMTALADELGETPEDNAAGVGLGWIQNARSLLRTNPRPSKGGPALTRLMSDIPSRAMVGYGRSGDEGGVPPTNIQPFRFRRWIFAHDGDGEFPKAMHEKLPEFIKRNVKGTSASEVLFHAYMAELHEGGMLDVPEFDRRRAAEAFARVVGRYEGEGAGEAFQATALTKKVVIAARTAGPLSYKIFKGLPVTPEPAFAGHRPKVVPNEAFRAVVVVNEAVEGAGWAEVPERKVVWFDQDWTAHFADIA